MKLVVAVGGASGSIYARRLLDALAALKARGAPSLEVGLCFSSAGAEVWQHELGAVPDYPFKRYGLRDFRAPFASGSAGWDSMVVVPCSTGGLARTDGVLHLIDMMREPGELFRDVAALDHDDHFLCNPLFRHLHTSLCSDIADALLIRREQLGANLVAAFSESLLQLTDRGDAQRDVGVQRLPFFLAHRDELRERNANE